MGETYRNADALMSSTFLIRGEMIGGKRQQKQAFLAGAVLAGFRPAVVKYGVDGLSNF